MITKRQEYEVASTAAKVVDELVDLMLQLDGIGEDIFVKWGDVGIMNARQEAKIAIYRNARSIFEEYRNTRPVDLDTDEDPCQTCWGGNCEYCPKN